MATRLKPTRINVDNTPRVGDGATYQDDNKFKWSEGGGDMSYEDFEWVTLTGNSLVIENISNNVTPTGNFTVTAGTLRPGIEYVLRVNTGNTPYTMTLGTGVTNPNSYKTELKPNTVNQFKFIATSTNQLELEGVDSAVVSEINWGEIGGTLSDQTDLQNALDQKLDKVISTATNPRAYVANADGSQATLPITDSATSGAIVRRNGTQITVPATPSANTDAASKKYVDDQVSEATAGAVSDTAYGTNWNGVTGIAPSKNAVYDKISTMDTAISGNTTNINTINSKIPSEASATNQLADKDFVGDSINSVTAYYITKNAAGDQWTNRAELFAATTFYSGGEVRVPTKNDYTIVLSDEQHGNATTRYIYNNGWEYQYTVNETAMTQAQLNAINSGITAAKVSQYDGYATTIAGKQDTLTEGTGISLTNNTVTNTGVTSVNGNTGAVTISEFNATNGGIKIFDMPTINSSMDSIIQWLSDLGDIALRQINNGVEYYYFLNNRDASGRSISVKNITGNTITTKGISYNASGICTGIVDTVKGIVTSVNGQTGDVTIESGGIQIAPNSPIKPKYTWYGTEADYANLSQYYTDTPGDTEFHTF